MNGTPISENAIQTPSMVALAAKIAENEYAIGYAGYGVYNMNTDSLFAFKVGGVEPTEVMMVMGNAIGVPTLLGKGETISALIAMEMGMAEVGSTHYSALYAAGLTLMVILFAINIVFALLKRKLAKEGSL